MVIDRRRSGHKVAVLMHEQMTMFEAGTVVEVLGLRWPELDVPWYELILCSESDAPVGLFGGAVMSVANGLEPLTSADTVVIPGTTDPHTTPSPAVIGAIRQAASNGARMVSICSGAFTLAAAGLLDGRPATTHWRYAELLQRRYPAVHVDPTPLYVDDGDVLTSAGCAAGIDLCLHLVRIDHGPDIANAIARRLVVPPHRDGGQAQYVERPLPATSQSNDIARSMEWICQNLQTPLSVQQLGAQAMMSPRTYARKFHAATGTSPMKWMIQQRILASLQILETTDMPLDHIAAEVGFARPVTFRHHFAKLIGTSPGAFRKQFRGHGRKRPAQLVGPVNDGDRSTSPLILG